MAAAVAAGADAGQPSPSKKSSQYNLLIDALSLARTSLAEQSRLLGDTQTRVQQLVSAQQRLQELAAVEVKKRRAVAARCHELEALNVGGANGDPKLMQRVATLRQQIGAMVREHYAVQLETETLQVRLREALATGESYQRQHEREQARLRHVQEAQERVAKQISETNAETEAAEKMATEREKELQAKLERMEQEEKERLEREMAEAEAAEPSTPAPSIAVAQVAPPPSGPIGGFEL